MSYTKYSPEDIEKLKQRLAKLEQDIKQVKLESKAHHTAIKDGTLRCIDTSDINRVKIGKLDTGVYGLIVNDEEENRVLEVSDYQIRGITTIIVSATEPEDPADKDVWIDI